jgi:hypothetical protein
MLSKLIFQKICDTLSSRAPIIFHGRAEDNKKHCKITRRFELDNGYATTESTV